MKDHDLLDQRPLIERYLNAGPRPLSSFSFVSLFAWCDFFEFECRTMDDALCIFARTAQGIFLYLPPLGRTWGPSTIKACFGHMARGGGPQKLNRIENIPENLLSAFASGEYNQYTKPAEYVYHKENLKALAGQAYKSQRHDCNCFLARHADSSFETYLEKDFEACMALFDRWAAVRGAAHPEAVYRSMLQENRLVHARLLKFCKTLGLEARVLKADGKIIGYTFGFGVDVRTFCIYAEIADLNHTGAAAYMFRSFCADAALKDFERINTMDDFAMPQVARTKQAYHPSEMVQSYSLTVR